MFIYQTNPAWMTKPESMGESKAADEFLRRISAHLIDELREGHISHIAIPNFSLPALGADQTEEALKAAIRSNSSYSGLQVLREGANFILAGPAYTPPKTEVSAPTAVEVKTPLPAGATIKTRVPLGGDAQANADLLKNATHDLMDQISAMATSVRETDFNQLGSLAQIVQDRMGAIQSDAALRESLARSTLEISFNYDGNGWQAQMSRDGKPIDGAAQPGAVVAAAPMVPISAREAEEFRQMGPIAGIPSDWSPQKAERYFAWHEGRAEVKAAREQTADGVPASPQPIAAPTSERIAQPAATETKKRAARWASAEPVASDRDYAQRTAPEREGSAQVVAAANPQKRAEPKPAKPKKKAPALQLNEFQTKELYELAHVFSVLQGTKTTITEEHRSWFAAHSQKKKDVQYEGDWRELEAMGLRQDLILVRRAAPQATLTQAMELYDRHLQAKGTDAYATVTRASAVREILRFAADYNARHAQKPLQPSDLDRLFELDARGKLADFKTLLASPYAADFAAAQALYAKCETAGIEAARFVQINQVAKDPSGQLRDPQNAAMVLRAAWTRTEPPSDRELENVLRQMGNETHAFDGMKTLVETLKRFPRSSRKQIRDAYATIQSTGEAEYSGLPKRAAELQEKLGVTEIGEAARIVQATNDKIGRIGRGLNYQTILDGAQQLQQAGPRISARDAMDICSNLASAVYGSNYEKYLEKYQTAVQSATRLLRADPTLDGPQAAAIIQSPRFGDLMALAETYQAAGTPKPMATLQLELDRIDLIRKGDRRFSEVAWAGKTFLQNRGNFASVEEVYHHQSTSLLVVDLRELPGKMNDINAGVIGTHALIMQHSRDPQQRAAILEEMRPYIGEPLGFAAGVFRPEKTAKRFLAAELYSAIARPADVSDQQFYDIARFMESEGHLRPVSFDFFTPQNAKTLRAVAEREFGDMPLASSFSTLIVAYAEEAARRGLDPKKLDTGLVDELCQRVHRYDQTPIFKKDGTALIFCHAPEGGVGEAEHKGNYFSPQIFQKICAETGTKNSAFTGTGYANNDQATAYRFLDAIANTQGDLTIVFNNHGDTDKQYLGGAEVSVEELTKSALLWQQRNPDRQLVVLTDSCKSGEFNSRLAESWMPGFQLPLLISTSNSDRATLSNRAVMHENWYNAQMEKKAAGEMPAFTLKTFRQDAESLSISTDPSNGLGWGLDVPGSILLGVTSLIAGGKFSNDPKIILEWRYNPKTGKKEPLTGG